MRILVTGGAGFIGSHLVDHLCRAYPGATVVTFDKLTYAASHATLAHLARHKNHVFVRGDVANPEDVEPVFRNGVDVVFHLAAESHVDRSIAAPEAFVRTNVFGTYCLLEAARRYDVQKVVVVSTDEVYGPTERGAVGEDAPLLPSSPYAASKAGGDLLCQAYVRTYRLPVVITRCTNNYGPRQHPEKLIPKAILCALEDRPIPLYGDGQQRRDWLYVEDHCRALDAAMVKGEAGDVFHIAGGEERTNREVAETILRLLDRDPVRIAHVPDRPGHDRRYALDDRRTRHRLGWAPRVSFAEGLARTVEWYRRHRDWWTCGC
ncbi:dTDP-glucose 4,6-dehydratase [Calditerricola yamamurae]